MRLEIRLTSNCNYSCEYCDSLHDNKSKADEFNFIGFGDVLSQFKDPEIFIYGGEPTTHKDFIKLIEYLKEHSPDSEITVQTNLSNPDILQIEGIKINASFHSSQTKFATFLQNVYRIQSKIYEISFMDADDNDYKYFKILRNLFPGLVQFCPVIDSDIKKPSSTPRVKELQHKDIFKDIQDDWHFVKHDSGLSNYDYWKDNLNEMRGKPCSVSSRVIHLDSNYVYRCFNGMFFKPEMKTRFEDFIYNDDVFECPYDRCFFDMQ